LIKTVVDAAAFFDLLLPDDDDDLPSFVVDIRLFTALFAADFLFLFVWAVVCATAETGVEDTTEVVEEEDDDDDDDDEGVRVTGMTGIPME
jgi:hypothetical protein